MNREVGERFWSKVDKQSDADCWEWLASKMGYGYGQFSISPGKVILAHRYSWIMYYGEIPDGLSILHHCDNPGCVNPKHLFTSTQQDNLRDMCEKGRNGVGDYRRDKNGNAKLSLTDAKKILNYFKRGLATTMELSSIFDIGKTTIYKIANGKHWSCQEK